MISAKFNKDSNYAIAPGLWQWDYGQILQVSGTGITENIEIHFSLLGVGGEAEVLIAVYDDETDNLRVHIPGHLLTHQTNRDYNIYAFIYFNSGSEGETVYKIILPIKARPKPINYDDTADDAFNATLAEAVQQVNDAKESAQTSASEARQSADEAFESANRSSELAEEIESQVAVAVSSAESAANSATQASESASNANQSANNASSSADSAGQSATSAQTSASQASASAGTANAAATSASASAASAYADAERAEQAAATSGYLWFYIEDGKLYMDRTANTQVDFFMRDGKLYVEERA